MNKCLVLSGVLLLSATLASCGGGGSPSALPNIQPPIVLPGTTAPGIPITSATSSAKPQFVQQANAFYVAAGGTNNGTCASASSPCASISYATQQALSANANGQVQTVNLGPGGWNESVSITGGAENSGTVGHNNQLVFNGSGSTTVWNGSPGSCGVLIANYGANVGVQNITMVAEGDPCQSALYAQLGGLIQVYAGMAFGPTYQQQMHAEGTGSQIQLWNSYTINGSANSHLGAVSGALIELNPTGIVVTLAGLPSFPGGFVQEQANAIVYIGAATVFGGLATGPKYNVSSNATLFTDGLGCTVIPGSSAGDISSGGLCL